MKGITFSVDEGKLSMKDHIEAAKMMDDYFKTDDDSEQAQINVDNINWVHENIIDCGNVIKSNNKIIGCTFIVPCNKGIMNKFLSNKINENQLFEEVKKNVNYDNFDTIYLCSSFIKPEFRGKGLAIQGRIKSIKKIIRKRKIKPILFYDAWTPEGDKSCKKVAEILNFKIRKRE